MSGCQCVGIIKWHEITMPWNPLESCNVICKGFETEQFARPVLAFFRQQENWEFQYVHSRWLRIFPWATCLNHIMSWTRVPTLFHHGCGSSGQISVMVFRTSIELECGMMWHDVAWCGMLAPSDSLLSIDTARQTFAIFGTEWNLLPVTSRIAITEAWGTWVWRNYKCMQRSGTWSGRLIAGGTKKTRTSEKSSEAITSSWSPYGLHSPSRVRGRQPVHIWSHLAPAAWM